MPSPLRLAPDPTAPAQARHAVAAALPRPDQSDLRDVAALLVSELVTNAVVHAASTIELDVEVAGDAITVRVRDADTGPLVMSAGGGSELDEGGRGFVLIDRLADAWGTEHHGGRKTVWFRLNEATDGAPEAAPADSGPEATPTPPTPPAPPMTLTTLLLPPTLSEVVTFDEHVGELLARGIDATGVAGLAVRFDTTDPRTLARGAVATSPRASFDLVIEDRPLGTLDVHAPDAVGAEVEAFLRLLADRISLLAAQHGLLAVERARAADLDLLTEATELLTRSLNVSLSLTLLTQIVVPRLADWCAAYVVEERLRPRRLIVNHRLEDRHDLVVELLDRDAELLAAVDAVATDATARRLPVTVSVAGQRNSVTVLPLSSRSRVLGVLVLGRPQPLDAMSFMAASELARRAALAVDNARLHEQQAATVTALQSSLLPNALPNVADLEVAARYHSASADVLVGGDFYDAFVRADGAVVLAIGDVCGKGAEAAAVTGTMRDTLRLLLSDGAGLAAALRRLNRAIADHPNGGRFCTVALAHIAPSDAGSTVRVCLAGHPEPVLLRGDGSTELVGVAGDLLGVLDDDVLQLTEVEVALAPGDSLVLYTDGVTERRDGTTMFGQEGVRRTLRDLATASADDIADHLERAARSFVDTDLRDDVAILVAKRLGPGTEV